MDWRVIYFVATLAVVTSAQLYEGDRCNLNGGIRGRCKLLRDCASVYGDFLQGRIPSKTCGYAGFDPIICCPFTKDDRPASTTGSRPPLVPMTVRTTTLAPQLPTTIPSLSQSPMGSPTVTQDDRLDVPSPEIPTSFTTVASTSTTTEQRVQSTVTDRSGIDDESLASTASPQASDHSSDNNKDISWPQLLNMIRDRVVGLENLIDSLNRTSTTVVASTTTTIASTTDASPVEQAVDLTTVSPAQLSPSRVSETNASSDSSTGSASIKRCMDYGEQLCPKGVSGLFAGNLKVTEYPHMAAIGFKVQNATSWLCSGAIVSENFVLSTAQCQGNPIYGIPEVAKLGSLQFEETYESDEARPQLRAIVQILPHPLYKPTERYNDIALYKLDRPATFNYYVRQACLSPYPTNEGISRNMVQSVGWKDADWGDSEGSKGLLITEFTLLDHKACNESYSTRLNDPQMPLGIDDATQICASSDVKEVCQIDIGGPVVQKNREYQCIFDVIGLTSARNLCGKDVLEVYTRVYNYLPWLESVIWNQTTTN